jgi:hypothetical protein
MKNDRLFSGLVLVIIGTVFLLHNFDVIDFHWTNLFRLWPMFLVIGGINLLLSNTRTVWATVIKVAVLVVGLGFVLLSNPGKNNQSSPFFYHFDNDDNRNDDADITNTDSDMKKLNMDANTYEKAFTPGVKIARLNIGGGATNYILKDTTTGIFKANTRERYGRYNLEQTLEDSVAVIDFDMNKHSKNHFSWDVDHMNQARISLSAIPVWDINLRGGATKMNFDLTPFKVRNMSISGGAASCKVKLAANLPVTRLTVSAGASEINIEVPKGAACDIVTSTGLSSNDFEGFTKLNGGHYTTAGFETAINKIYLRLKGGVSDFNVSRY